MQGWVWIIFACLIWSATPHNKIILFATPWWGILTKRSMYAHKKNICRLLKANSVAEAAAAGEHRVRWQCINISRRRGWAGRSNEGRWCVVKLTTYWFSFLGAFAETLTHVRGLLASLGSAAVYWSELIICFSSKLFSYNFRQIRNALQVMPAKLGTIYSMTARLHCILKLTLSWFKTENNGVSPWRIYICVSIWLVRPKKNVLLRNPWWI